MKKNKIKIILIIFLVSIFTFTKSLSEIIIYSKCDHKEDVFLKVFKSIKKLANKKVKNYIAKQWIDNQLRVKKMMGS